MTSPAPAVDMMSNSGVRRIDGTAAAATAMYSYQTGAIGESGFNVREVSPDAIQGPARSKVVYAPIWGSLFQGDIPNVTFCLLLAILTGLIVFLSVQIHDERVLQFGSGVEEREEMNSQSSQSSQLSQSSQNDFVTGYMDVVIGNTLDTRHNTKCVDAPESVQCDDTAQQMGRTGEYPDKFHIYHMGDKICARRTDHDGFWGLNLVLRCKTMGSSSTGTTSEGAAEGVYTVTIGSSTDSHTKCVPAPGGVFCDRTAHQLGRTGQYSDTFDIFHEGTDKICAKRTDHPDPWGLNLVLQCRNIGVSGGKIVHIGTNHDGYKKCVSDPGDVQCDHESEQLGRDGRYPDTFKIYHENGQICAERTDHQDPWGLNLILKCRRESR